MTSNGYPTSPGRPARRGLWLAIAALALGFGPAQAQQEPAERPNFLLIVVDDMGMADLGAFGGEIPTPNLDALALDGVRLTNFHAAPVCSPTRAMLLTGVDNHKAGLGNLAELMSPNQKGQPGYEGALSDRVVTVASLLQEAGYNTYLAGKWHLGMTDGALPYQRGFDRSFAMLAGGASHYPDMRPAYHPDPNGKAPYIEDSQRLTELPADFHYSSQYYVDKMIDYLAEDADSGKPFFAYLAFTAPHWPLQAPAETIARYHGAYDAGYDALLQARLARQKELGIVPADAPENIRPAGTPPWDALSADEQKVDARAMEVYAAMIDEVDSNVGRLIAALKESGALDNTVVIFMSDNGAEGHDLNATWPAEFFPEIRKNIDARHDFSFENMGAEKSYVLYGPGWARAGEPAASLYKGFPTEGGTRVAAFAHYGDFASGAISNRYLTVRDVTPTLLEMAGVAHPDSFDGRAVEPMTGQSMLPVLTGTAGPEGEILDAGEVLGKGFVRKGDWKMVRMPVPFGTGDWQLFDLASDPAESIDLAAEHPEVMAELMPIWQAYAAENGVIAPDWSSGY